MRARLPDWLQPVAAWLLRPNMLVALAVLFVVLFVLSAVGVPWFLARVPADYFSPREREELGMSRPQRRVRALLRFGKNVLGLLLCCSPPALRCWSCRGKAC
jgi:hypothetical protein